MKLKNVISERRGSYRDLAKHLLIDNGVISAGDRSASARKKISTLTDALRDLNDTQAPNFSKGQELTLPEDFMGFYREFMRSGTAANNTLLTMMRANGEMTFLQTPDAAPQDIYAFRETHASYDSGGMRTQIIDAARQYVGMREQGHNRGEVDRFRLSALDATQTPVAEGSPYCALFVGTALKDQLGYNPLGGTASTAEVVRMARAAGAYHAAASYAPQAGDIAYLREGGGGHVALVKEVLPNGDLVLIEGNVGRGANAGVHETVLTQGSSRARHLAGFVNIDGLVAATRTDANIDARTLARADRPAPAHIM